MAKEALWIPEENLEKVLNVIEAGLWQLRTQISEDTLYNLEKWCKEEWEYIKRLRGK